VSQDGSLYKLATGCYIGLEFLVGTGIFLFFTESNPTVVPTQPPVRSVAGHETHSAPSSSVEVKNMWSFTSVCLHSAVLTY